MHPHRLPGHRSRRLRDKGSWHTAQHIDAAARPVGNAVHPLFAWVPHDFPGGSRLGPGLVEGVSSVALSDRDQCRLREIEEHTVATDPGFVTRLDLAGVLRRRRQLRRICWWLQALGAWMTLMGLSAAHGVISIGVLVAGFGLTFVVWSTITARGVRLPTPRR